MSQDDIFKQILSEISNLDNDKLKELCSKNISYLKKEVPSMSWIKTAKDLENFLEFVFSSEIMIKILNYINLNISTLKDNIALFITTVGTYSNYFKLFNKINNAGYDIFLQKVDLLVHKIKEHQHTQVNLHTIVINSLSEVKVNKLILNDDQVKLLNAIIVILNVIVKQFSQDNKFHICSYKAIGDIQQKLSLISSITTRNIVTQQDILNLTNARNLLLGYKTDPDDLTYEPYFNQGFITSVTDDIIQISTGGARIDPTKTLGEIQQADPNIFAKVNAFLMGRYCKQLASSECDDNTFFKAPYQLDDRDPIKGHLSFKWPWIVNELFEDPMYQTKNMLINCHITEHKYKHVEPKIHNDKLGGIRIVDHENPQSLNETHSKYKAFEEYFYNLVSKRDSGKLKYSNVSSFAPFGAPDLFKTQRYDLGYSFEYNKQLLVNLLCIVSQAGEFDADIIRDYQDVLNEIKRLNIYINPTNQQIGSYISFCLENYDELLQRHNTFINYFSRGDRGHEWISSIYFNLARKSLDYATTIIGNRRFTQEDQELFIKCYSNFRKRCLGEEFKYWDDNPNLINYNSGELHSTFKDLIWLFKTYDIDNTWLDKQKVLYKSISRIIVKKLLESDKTFIKSEALYNTEISGIDNCTIIIGIITWILDNEFQVSDLTKFYNCILDSNLKEWFFYIICVVKFRTGKTIPQIIDCNDINIKTKITILKDNFIDNIICLCHNTYLEQKEQLISYSILNHNYITLEEHGIFKNLLASAINNKIPVKDNGKSLNIIDNIAKDMNFEGETVSDIIHNTINRIYEHIFKKKIESKQESKQESNQETELGKRKASDQELTEPDLIDYKDLCDNAIICTDCNLKEITCKIPDETLKEYSIKIASLYKLKSGFMPLILKIITKAKIYKGFYDLIMQGNLFKLYIAYSQICIDMGL